MKIAPVDTIITFKQFSHWAILQVFPTERSSFTKSMGRGFLKEIYTSLQRCIHRRYHRNFYISLCISLCRTFLHKKVCTKSRYWCFHLLNTSSNEDVMAKSFLNLRVKECYIWKTYAITHLSHIFFSIVSSSGVPSSGMKLGQILSEIAQQV